MEPTDGRATVMAFSPDGNRLFTGFDLGSGIVWDVRRGPGAPRANSNVIPTCPQCHIYGRR
jgi:hypothetical protein